MACGATVLIARVNNRGMKDERHRNYGQRNDSIREEVNEKTHRHPQMY
jgi:hypothetical protein